MFRFSRKTQWHVSEAIKKTRIDFCLRCYHVCITNWTWLTNDAKITNRTRYQCCCLWVGHYLFIDWLSIFLKRGDWGRASILSPFWIDTDKVIVQWCFGTASLSSDFEPKSLSLHQGRLQKGLVFWGAVHLSIFCNDCVATEICEKILEVFYRFFHDCVTWNSWDQSQVSRRRWWAISLIPCSCVHPRSLPGNLGNEDSVPAFAVFSRSVNCPSRRVFHLRHALFVSLTAFWLTADPLSHFLWTLLVTTMKPKEN